MARGWVPPGDDGAIVFRSWLVLSSHSPLVGQLTHVTSHHAAFDPGPMLFWFLTIPVHLDHLQGGLWGATLLCIVSVSLAVEAAWSAIGWPGAAGAVAVVLAMVAEFPALALDPTWNAHVGTMWFIATAAIAWAVAVGRLRWWPVLVVAASLAAQSHLMFFVASMSCVIVAPIFGVIRNRKVGWWLPVGVLAGLVCWVAPLWQQLTSHPGNLSLLLDSENGAGPSTGLAFSLQALAASVGPRPVWWGQGQVPAPNFFSLVTAVRAHPAWLGVAILVGLVVVLVAASLAKSRALAGLALVALLLSLGSVWSLAALPTSQFFSFFYIGPGWWPVGMIVLLVGGWSIGAVALAAARARRRGVISGRSQRPRTRVRGWATSCLVGTTLALIAAGGALMVHDSAANQNPTEGWPAIHQVRLATDRIEHAVPRGRLVVRPPSGFSTSYAVIAGVDWLLYADGWRPESPPGFPTLFGPELSITKPAPPVTVVVTYNGGPAKIAITRGDR
jgi:hypothetical protein